MTLLALLTLNLYKWKGANVYARIKQNEVLANLDVVRVMMWMECDIICVIPMHESQC